MSYKWGYMHGEPDAGLPDYLEEQEPVHVCAWCGESIYPGDEFYELPNGVIVCMDCMDECKHTAEEEEEPEDPWEDLRVEQAIERWKGIE